jgi:hypothetical protein
MSEREKADYYERVQGTYADFYWTGLAKPNYCHFIHTPINYFINFVI